MSQQEHHDAMLRQLTMSNINQHYSALIQTINNIQNIQPEMKRAAFQNLDQGLFWIEKAIQITTFPLPSLDEKENGAAIDYQLEHNM